jgi:hypothetical protein
VKSASAPRFSLHWKKKRAECLRIPPELLEKSQNQLAAAANQAQQAKGTQEGDRRFRDECEHGTAVSTRKASAEVE